MQFWSLTGSFHRVFTFIMRKCEDSTDVLEAPNSFLALQIVELSLNISSLTLSIFVDCFRRCKGYFAVSRGCFRFSHFVLS